jgi:hypothetical protein
VSAAEKAATVGRHLVEQVPSVSLLVDRFHINGK